eukprot:186650-Chlamydomonas_euryale.AAC.2
MGFPNPVVLRMATSRGQTRSTWRCRRTQRGRAHFPDRLRIAIQPLPDTLLAWRVGVSIQRVCWLSAQRLMAKLPRVNALQLTRPRPNSPAPTLAHADICVCAYARPCPCPSAQVRTPDKLYETVVEVDEQVIIPLGDEKSQRNGAAAAKNSECVPSRGARIEATSKQSKG